jgi:glycosyltransferase involved in cell wall biosynthesis
LALGSLNQEDSRLIRGSGVDLLDCPFVPEPQGTPVVVMAARLLKDKGVFEFVESARLLQDRGVGVEMKLIGSSDPGNPNSVTKEDLDRWKKEGIVQVLGFRKDVTAQYATANIVCLPSYYGEGLPKSLVEAAACGRAVVTTDHPGCRDAIVPCETGVLIPVKDPIALADVIERLIEHPNLRQEMGKAGRCLAEEVFSIDKIVEQHLEIYSDLLDER